MRITQLALIAIGMLLAGCTGNTPPVDNPATATPASDAPVPFVSVPELKDVMCCMMEMSAETLWNAGLEKEPSTDEDWKPIENAAIGLIETGRFIQKSHLAKNNDDWVQFAQAQIDAATEARQTVKERDLAKVMAAGEKLLKTCENCHMKYFNPPPDIPPEIQASH
jgi:hypothetical protein